MVLNQWLQGAQTEQSFADLANDISMDPGSAFNPPQCADVNPCVDYDILFPAYSPHFS